MSVSSEVVLQFVVEHGPVARAGVVKGTERKVRTVTRALAECRRLGWVERCGKEYQATATGLDELARRGNQRATSGLLMANCATTKTKNKNITAGVQLPSGISTDPELSEAGYGDVVEIPAAPVAALRADAGLIGSDQNQGADHDGTNIGGRAINRLLHQEIEYRKKRNQSEAYKKHLDPGYKRERNRPWKRLREYRRISDALIVGTLTAVELDSLKGVLRRHMGDFNEKYARCLQEIRYYEAEASRWEAGQADREAFEREWITEDTDAANAALKAAFDMERSTDEDTPSIAELEGAEAAGTRADYTDYAGFDREGSMEPAPMNPLSDEELPTTPVPEAA